MNDRSRDSLPTPRELAGEAGSPAWIELARTLTDRRQWVELGWTGTLAEYLEQVRERPALARNAYQRLYDMVVGHGSVQPPPGSDAPPRYRFFDDPEERGREAIFGLEEPLADLVTHLRAAAHGLGAERRVLLLHGPVGSSKSTIARLLKRGLERYSLRPEGALYSFRWRLPDGVEDCPMHEDPLHLLPPAARDAIFADLNRAFDGEYPLAPSGRLCPVCRFHQERLLRESGGDFAAVEQAIEVYRLVLSEQDRVGIGTFQPKDEKNQDSTELTGDINYRLIARYGSDSDPRAFNFDGEFHVANRGLVEFVEILKLDVAFLYDLLGATQEHTVKPRKFAQTDIDEVILGHTNSPEFRRLQGNELMEAFRDRTTRIDVPYNVRLADEVRIYLKTFGPETCAGRHLAPHAIEAAALWAVLTRLEEPKNQGLSLLGKLRLYDGRSFRNFTPAVVPELRAEATAEGMTGASPRYVQDRIAAALVSGHGAGCLSPFDVLDSLAHGLRKHPLIDSDELRRRYAELVALVREELEETLKSEVRAAVAADTEAVGRLCGNYVDAVTAFVDGGLSSDERLMRSIEEKIGVTESRKGDFRREIVHYIEALAARGESFTHGSNPRLRSALEAKLFDDCRDTFKLTAGASTAVDPDVLEKLDLLASRLVRDHGYCEDCARAALARVGGLLARAEPPRAGGEESA